MLSSCITRDEVNASVWLNNGPIPNEICAREPALRDYGFFRRLNDGSLEFISFCTQQSRDWVSVYRDDFNRIMDALLPKGDK